jgi:hypothetical protein
MTKNFWKGLLITMIFALGVIAFAYRMNLIYNQNNLTKGDSTFYFYSTGIVLQTAKSSGIANALSLAVSWLAHNTILHYLVAAILSPVLPVKTTVGVMLNSIWYLIMAASLYIFVLDKTRSVFLSFLLSIPMLIAGPPLADPYQGLADLHVNLLGYTLGVTVMCFVLLSDDFRKPWPAVLGGVFFGLLLLGRVFSAALVGIAVAPILLRGVFWVPKPERAKALRSILFFGGAVLLISGWWFLPRLISLVMYPLKFALLNHPGRSVAVGSISSNAIIWLDVVRSFFFYTRAYYPLALVLLGIVGTEILSSRDIRLLMKRVNWLYIWMGVAPLLVLILIRSDYKYYGWPALLGLYLSIVLPFKSTEQSIQPLKTPVFPVLLFAALACATFGFATRMYSMHTDYSTSKKSATLVAEKILNDAKRANENKTEIKVGFSYYGSLTPATLANVLLFDIGCKVIWYEPSPPVRVQSAADCARIHLSYEITQYPLNWDQSLSGDATRTVEMALEEISRQADFVVILSPESWETEPGSYPEHWPEWVELSKQLYYLEDFDVITPIWTINPPETVVVLRRAPGN